MNYGDNRLFLYDNNVDLVVTADNLYVDNRPMNNNSLIAHKGLTNTINFNIRNRDRKLQNVFADNLVAYFVNPSTKSRMLTKRLENSSNVGIVQLYLTAGDLQNIDVGLYKVYITRTNDTSADMPVYSSQNNDVCFDIEISGQAVFDPVPTQTDTTLTEVASNVFVSSAFFGNLDRNFQDAKHSIAIYPTTYTGNVKIQASCLPTTPNSDATSDDWFDLSAKIAITGASSAIIHKTYSVNANWIRLVSYPDNADSTIANVLVRN